jgi:hypothetical protein
MKPLLGLIACLAMITPAYAAAPDQALVELAGADFAGGAREHFGAAKLGEQVNYVYAQPTGAAVMRAGFELKDVPDTPLFLHLKALDDDAAPQCKIDITINGQSVFAGMNKFSRKEWRVQRFALPAGVLKAGKNEIVITNAEQEGKLGMPPWFMVATAVIGPEKYVHRRDITKDFVIELPKEMRELPEPLPAGAEPGFKIRGTKGWAWTPEQYLAEIPVLAKYKMNFLMNCYTSVFSDFPKFVNRWWEPMPEQRKADYAKVIKACQANGINFCFAIHPQFGAPRPMDPTSEKDFELLWPHFAWAQSQGVKWFAISLDDIQGQVKVAGEEHARMCNKLIARLREKDPKIEFILCPTWYWGDGTGKDQKPYLEALARELDPQAYLFWTGDAVVGPITRKGAETFRGLSKHRIVLWDNYPVNDNRPTLHLGPVIDRDADLCAVVDGYMGNPLCPQSEINRIPLLTCADYAYNPAAYDPGRSIGQAILHLAGGSEDSSDAALQNRCAVLKDLVEAYAGMLIWQKPNTGLNCVREQYQRIATAPHSRTAALAYIAWLEDLSARMDKAFPKQYRDAKATVDADVVWTKAAFAAKYGQ